jgi:hypothetical protein
MLASTHRSPSRAIGFALFAGVAIGAFGCNETLNAGRNSRADPCESADAGLRECAPPGLLDGLVGFWRLDDSSGSTVAADSSGQGNHGALHELDPSAAWVSGRSRGALQIAQTGWVQVPPSPSIDGIVQDVTVTAWVRFETEFSNPDSWGVALSRQTGTGKNQHYHLALYGDGRPSFFLITASGFVLIRDAVSVPKNEWVHLAGVYDGAMARLYLNGIELESQALTGRFAEDTTPVILGGNGNDASGIPTELFPGPIDELMLYSRALSATEIGDLAAGVLFPKDSMDAGGP